MSDKVLCPYCPEGVEMFPTYNEGGVVKWACRCGAEAPGVVRKPEESFDDAAEKARVLALRRSDPPNRVLTLNDIHAVEKDENGYFPCYIEKPGGIVFDEDEKEEELEQPELFACAVSFCEADGMFVAARIDENDELRGVIFNEINYGQIFRIWLRKPTEEERKAVPWE